MTAHPRIMRRSPATDNIPTPAQPNRSSLRPATASTASICPRRRPCRPQQRIAGLVPSAQWSSGITAPSLPGNVASLLKAQQNLNLPTNLLPGVGSDVASQMGTEGLNTLAGTAQESFVGVEETSLMMSALSQCGSG
ncbi:hypothetical protein [Dickeya fangzhongdai]|uniref:hypothetical protein n=1 Tax=Dickeya fangzhongdai TaxID=1778540 RepID=UPI001F0AAE06|nr:hypothetical protein [Dickeya fangzhongdai]